MENVNVCLLNDSFPPLIDGVANTVLNYAGIIQKNYGQATVVTPKYPDVVDEYPFPVLRYPSLNSTKLVGYRTGNPFGPKILRAIESRKFNVIHSHCPMVSTLLARSARELCHAPLILTYHTKFDIDIQKAVDSELVQKAALWAMMNNVNACDEVWVVSHGAGENLRNLGYEGKYRVMENGVDFPRGRADEELVAKLRREYTIAEDETVYLFVGRIMWYKGLRLVADSLKRVAEAGEKFRMFFVGDGIDRKEVEEYIEKLGLSDQTVFTGAIRDRELLRGYFTMADLFLFPSVYDTNGIVVREAAACGLGSLLIAGSCAAEGIEHRETGLLAEENADSVSAQMIYASRNREAIHQLGQRAMDRIYISWESSVNKAVTCYGEVIENFLSGETKRKKSPSDELFSVAADIASDITKIHSIGWGIPKRMNELRQNVLGKLDPFDIPWWMDDEEVPESYYWRLQELRCNQNLERKEIAAILKTEPRIYTQYEEGKREIPAWAVARLADFYQTSTDYILGRTNRKEPYEEK